MTDEQTQTAIKLLGGDQRKTIGRWTFTAKPLCEVDYLAWTAHVEITGDPFRAKASMEVAPLVITSFTGGPMTNGVNGEPPHPLVECKSVTRIVSGQARTLCNWQDAKQHLKGDETSSLLMWLRDMHDFSEVEAGNSAAPSSRRDQESSEADTTGDVTSASAKGSSV